MDKIEKQFFETFEIEPTYKCIDDALEPCNEQCNDCGYYELRYPQINDRIYLMLLATLTCISSIEFPFSNIEKLKEDILKEVIKHQYGFDKHQVRTLFEEI